MLFINLSKEHGKYRDVGEVFGKGR